jgi:glycosyltransferase involved in cell wall biosynthesis
MNILFVHNNLPAQFRNVIRALAGRGDVRMAAIGSPSSRAMRGVQLHKYQLDGADVSATHPFARRFDLECRRAEQVLYCLSSLAAADFVPDVIVAHPGWGETLPLRTFFPRARIAVYCEFFYGVAGRDVGFDPEFPEAGLDGHVSLHLKNATTLLALSDGDVGVSPTLWQRSTFPRQFHDKIEVVHEGVDVDIAAPDEAASLRLPNGRLVTRKDQVVTFVARNLEPLRGYHIFMRALPRVLKALPEAEVVVIGGDSTSYGMKPPNGKSWKQMFLDEVAGGIDPKRLHFMGNLPYRRYLSALQVSSAHVYLTYPFVLSWSLLEAMSAGCVVIGSDTAPLHDVIDGKNGMLVPFFDTDALADRVVEAVSKPRRFTAMRARARDFVRQKYDAERICVPTMLKLIGGLSPESEPRL